MNQIGYLTTRFLDRSETFIYEPLKLIKNFHVIALALQRRNQELFPYEDIYTIDDLDEKKKKRDLFLGTIGREKYLASKIMEHDLKLIHAHYGFMGIYALQYKKKCNLPLITSFYGLDVYQHTQNPFYRFQLKRLFKKGELFLVCSNKMRQDLISLGAPASRTVVHYGAADLNKFTFSFKGAEEREDITILMCGRFVEKKGFEFGINAFLKVARENENIRLKIIGSGHLEAKFKHLIEKSPFGDQVELLGNCSHQEYIEELKNCHIFIAPSVTAKTGDSEGLPTVLIEAAALGKPLLATNHSGIAEIVHHRKNGLLSEEKDTVGLASNLRKMINDNYRWIDYAQYGRALVEKEFNFSKQIEKLEELYQEIIR
ncbi:glycosyltransferase [bacterium]|nr:glycosyltransferase [bacterium]